MTKAILTTKVKNVVPPRYMVDGEFVKDDAPFSCCDVQAARPCAHHDVHNISAHRQLGPLGTLYTTGCNDKLEWYWQSHVLTPLLLLLFFVSFVLVGVWSGCYLW